ncbi:hypothetical protein CR163_007935, partial [Prosthecochloris sp. ZM_2]
MSLHHLPHVATVATVAGNAWARTQDGSMRLLKSGDAIYQGEVIVTTQGGRVLLELPDGSLYPVQGELLAELQQPEQENPESQSEVREVDDTAEAAPAQEGSAFSVRASEEIGGTPSFRSSSNQAEYSDEPSGYLRLKHEQDIEQIQLVEGGNSFAPAPILTVSIVGSYNEGTGSRAGGYDAFLDGRATYNPRLIEGTDLLGAEQDAFAPEIRTFDGAGDDDEYVNRLPKPLPDVAEVVEGGNTVSGNVLENDADGNGRSTVISVTYVPEPQEGEDPGDPVTEDVPADGSKTVDSLYGTLTIYSDGRWEYLSDPYEAHDAPPSDAPLQDLFAYTVKDVDGDRASSTLTIDVLDTEPSIGTPEPGVVDEDDLDPNGTDLNADDKQPEISGSLGVEKAADPLDTKFLPADEQNDLNALNLKSAGNDIEYVLLDSSHTLVGYTGKLLESGIPGQDQIVFDVTINDPTSTTPDGSTYTFTLYQQLDHPFNDGENDIDLPLEFQVLDHDGDSDTDTVVVKVIDDIPVATGNVVTSDVWEDQLDTSNSVTGYGSTGNPDGDSGETAVVKSTGLGGSAASLAALVNNGADVPPVFSVTEPDPASGLSQDQFIAAQLGPLTSDGNSLHYDVADIVVNGVVTGQTITGYVESGHATGFDDQDGVVFVLDVYRDGEWSYELKDQLDHAGAGDDEWLTIDLTGIVMMSDSDGDSYNLGALLGSNAGMFAIRVENDVPELELDGTGSVKTTGGSVNEDALTLPDDESEGNDDAEQQKVLTGDGSAGNALSLSDIVSIGADEAGSYGFTGTSSADYQSALGKLSSSEDELSYEVTEIINSSGNAAELLTASAGTGPEERIVFTLEIEKASGDWVFDLNDQLDHVVVPGEDGDEQYKLKDSDTDSATGYKESLDFSEVVGVEDGDGDSASLYDMGDTAGVFAISVENDVPALTTEASSGTATVGGAVHEDALGNDG